MGTLQTEIFNKVLPKMKTLETLTFDDEGNTPLTNAKTANKSKLIWEYLRDRGPCTAKEVTKAFGYTESNNAGAYITSLYRRDLLTRSRDSGDFKYATKKGMTTYPNPGDQRIATMRRNWEAEQKTKTKTTDEPHKETQPAQVVEPQPVTSDAKAYVETLNVKQARELYAALKEVFSL